MDGNKGEEKIGKCEEALSGCIEEAVKEESFYDLQISNIISIIKRSNIKEESESVGLDVMKAILLKMSSKRPNDAPLLLNVCDFPHLLLDRCLELISCLQSSPPCPRVGFLPNFRFATLNQNLKNKTRYSQRKNKRSRI